MMEYIWKPIGEFKSRDKTVKIVSFRPSELSQSESKSAKNARTPTAVGMLCLIDRMSIFHSKYLYTGKLMS